MNYAKAHCAEQMILCEGYMDVIAMHAAGFENAVATLGTAITQEHARMLSRYTKRVLINYDSDEAGQRAASKAMALLDAVGMEVRVLKITGAKDADEYLRTYGKDAFRSMITESRTAFDFKLEGVLARHDVNTVDGKIRAARELSEIIAAVGSGVERELYIASASKALGISKENIANDVKRFMSKEHRQKKEKEHRELILSARNFGDRINPDAAKDPAAAAAEDAIIGMLLLFPEHRKSIANGKTVLEKEDFFTEMGRRAFVAIMEMEQGEHGFVFSALGEQFNADEMGRLTRLMRERDELQNNDEALLGSYADALRRCREKREERESGNWQSALARRRAALQKKQEEK